MAVTKIKAIRGTLSKAIAYILNPEKTDEKLLVSSYGCASETAAREFEWTRKIAEQKGMNPVRIIARHVIQSFEIGEVTPEKPTRSASSLQMKSSEENMSMC